MKAAKVVSLLFPLPLDAGKYSEGRMVGQVGFTYYDEDLVRRVVSDEYELLKQAGGFPFNSFDILNNINFRLIGKRFSRSLEPNPEKIDLDEQDELEKSESKRGMSKILDDLRNLKAADSEQIKVHNKVYKRDNKTIVQLKIVRGYRCQMCCSTIRKKDGSLYIEAAHITPKKEKGTELPSNIILLCPNHHKEFDIGEKEILKRDEKLLIVILNGSRYSIDLQV